MKVGLETQGGAAESGSSPHNPPPPLAEVARLFPQLEILECLGCGGMGAVYKARQPRLDRLVALKIIVPDRGEQARDAHFAERFEREARALARLNHPNIVAVYDFGEAGGLPYLIMEYVDGLNLRQLEHAGKLSPPEALRIVPQVCEALQFAHEAGIVHRDIKPENILLDQKGRVKIADFGIAKILGGDQVRQTLTQNQVLGTPHYMAPEQVEHPQLVDRRADIFSLGVVFYEMLTGELPLGKFAPPSRRMHGIQVDVRLDEVVLHALEKEPERRYQQASEVKTDVELIAVASAQTSPPPVSTPKAQKPAGFAPRRRWTFWSGSQLPFFLLFLLPPLLLTTFVLFGYRWVGVDLGPDVQGFTGLLGLPLSAGLGALLAWAAWSLTKGRQTGTEGRAVSPSRWSWLALGAAAVLAISLPLGGGALVLLQLISKDPSWNPGKSEYLITVLMVGGAFLAALASTLMGLESSRRIRGAPAAWRGRPGACAAAWFWPCLLGCVSILWGADVALTALRGGVAPSSAEYITAPVTRGPLTVDVVASGRLMLAAGNASEWRIEASLSETIVAHIKVGQDAECVTDAFPGRPFKGKVIRIGDAPQPRHEATTYPAIIQVADAQLPFREGMSVFLTFVLAHRQDTLRIRCQAFTFQMPGSPLDPENLRFGLTPEELSMADAAERSARTVWVLRTPKKDPEPVKVRIGISDSTWTEILEGLNEGDRVVIGISETPAPQRSRNAPGPKPVAM